MNQLIPLKKGSKIGIAAPSSPFKREDFDKAVSFLQSSGFTTVYSDVIFNKNGFVSGTPEDRAKDLLALINNDEISSIFFVRGGYGSAQILPLIDKKDLSKKISKKILMGYSDLTALFCHLYKKYKIPMFYGPNIINKHLNSNVISKLSTSHDLKIKVQLLKTSNKVVTAPIFGGCLSVLTSMVGTPYLKSLKGHILFLEDTNEPPYKIDRMLNQLLSSGVIKGIKAIAVGSMENCETAPYSWKDAVLRIAEILNVPVVSGIMAGHGGFDYPLPMGVKAKIDFANQELLIYSPFNKKNK
ncbi:MAG: LD-carboxypeptidase [bacterium]